MGIPGAYDASQFGTIQEAVAMAAKTKGIVYFPPGTYPLSQTLNIDETVTLLGTGGRPGASIILGDQPTGDMIRVTGHSVVVRGLTIENRGSGSALRFLATQLKFNHALEDCSVLNTEANTNDLVSFQGAHTRIVGNYIHSKNLEAYACRCEQALDTAAVQVESLIAENHFAGVGKGIIVSSQTRDKRPEGLRISRNAIINTGSEQLTIRTGFAIGVYDNTFGNGRSFAIWLNTEMGPIIGLTISNNMMDVASALTQREKPNEVPNTDRFGEKENNYLGTAINGLDSAEGVRHLRVMGNFINACGYGITLGSQVELVAISNNSFASISHTGITTKGSQNVIITGNHLAEFNQAFCLSLAATPGRYLVTNNYLSGNVDLAVSELVMTDNYGP